MNFDSTKIDAIIFDLDGTLWDSSQQVCDAWNLCLKDHPEIQREPILVTELFSCMGLPMYDIAEKLFPKEAKDIREPLMDEMCIFENAYLAKTGGILYDGLIDVLGALSSRYPLFIVSNCQDGYIESFLQAHQLHNYFKDTECWGRTRVSKGESNRILIKRNGLKNAVYVGDTASDQKSAEDADIPFIYASYGFGTVQNAKYQIDSIKELVKLLELG